MQKSVGRGADHMRPPAVVICALAAPTRVRLKLEVDDVCCYRASITEHKVEPQTSLPQMGVMICISESHSATSFRINQSV